MEDLKPGDRVNWMWHNPVTLMMEPIYAEILKVLPSRVRIRVYRVDRAGKKVAVTKTVDRETISPRSG